MKTIAILVLSIAVAGALVFVVLPHFGIRTLPSRVEYFSEPEPETVEYMARPAIGLGKQILSPSVSQESKDSTWEAARGKWVLWKGSVHSIEPALNPSRIVLVYEYEAPLPFYTQRFGVVVKFEAQWSESLKQLIPGETVYFRAKLVERDFRLADVYRYGLDFSSYVLLLEHGQIIDRDDRAARLVDLAYTSYDHLDLLVSLAEQTATVRNYFEQRLELDWVAIRALEIFAPVYVRIPDSPGQASEAVLAPIRAIKTNAEANIETSVASALNYLHTASSTQKDSLTKFVEDKQGIHTSLVTDECIAAQKLWEAYELQRASPGLKELALGIPKLAYAVEGIVREILKTIGGFVGYYKVIEVLGDLQEAEKVVVSCYILLGAITSTMAQINDDVAQAAVLVVN